LELVYALRDAGAIAIDADRRAIAATVGLRELDFPETIEGVIAHRVDRLSSGEQAILKAASVLGRSFPEPLVTEIGAVRRPTTARTLLERLAGHDILRRDAAGEYRFEHVLIRDVVYGRLLSSQRQHLHQQVALHHERAGNASDTAVRGVIAHHW